MSQNLSAAVMIDALRVKENQHANICIRFDLYQYNYLSASAIFANSLDSTKARQSTLPNLDPICFTLDFFC